MAEVKILHKSSDDLLTIGELAERCGVATSAIRYYEAEKLLASSRTSGNQRRFKRETIRRVAFIQIGQNLGRTLDEIRAAMLQLPQNRTPTKADWTVVAQQWRPRIEERIEHLQQLHKKLDGCIACGCLSMENCHLYNPEDKAYLLGPGSHISDF